MNSKLFRPKIFTDILSIFRYDFPVMSAPLNWSNLHGYRVHSVSSVLCTVELTVPTGFEAVAKQEAIEKLNVTESSIEKHEGRLLIDVPVETRLLDIFTKLRTVDNAYVVIGVVEKNDFENKSKEESLEYLKKLIHDDERLGWARGIRVWQEAWKFDGTDPLDSSNSDHLPSFRCTCYRSGNNHSFASPEVARDVGGEINERFKWPVKLKGFDIELVVNVDIDQVYFTISLNRTSLFKRNILHFGPTALRPTICSGILGMVGIQKGDLVVDPMCGSASIPIEGALQHTNSLFIAGDIHEKAYRRSADNLKAIAEGKVALNVSNVVQGNVGEERRDLNIDVCCWDVRKLPLRSNLVDVFVTDLPFGRRSGSKFDNRALYPSMMNSIARCAKVSSGRAAILTFDKNTVFKSVHKFSQYWKLSRTTVCNIGGLKAIIFLFNRTDALFCKKDAV